ncbi:hydroxyethylthiazole kinase [Halomarina ordinaria]|uniref:Hydroxyethylthiazole kinase n=1 Tax=Halomarina ordinaria TaxID=3033939 RepID=A0ABD5U8D2_9EURY|nr:hydroxyethylthiazole kinase [Halomarina sp. PSRA2]
MSESVQPTLASSLASVAATGPLVHSVTNAVTVNDVANVTLHWGGLPVMADDEREVAEMVAGADALLLNAGDVSERGERTMVAAGRAANDHGVPVVLDPVGVGATPTRTAVAERLVAEVDLAVVKGNYGEVSTLAGAAGEVRGVESVGEYADIAATARACADTTGSVVVASGERDVIATSERAFGVEGGHPMLGRVVGTGCMLGVTLATFCGAVADPLTASVDAVVGYGLAAERAAETEYGGPASYKIRFLDAVAGLSPEAVDADLAGRVTRLDG